MTPPLGLPVGSVRAIQFLVATGTGATILLGHAFGVATPDPEVLALAAVAVLGGPALYAKVRGDKEEMEPPPYDGVVGKTMPHEASYVNSVAAAAAAAEPGDEIVIGPGHEEPPDQPNASMPGSNPRSGD